MADDWESEDFGGGWDNGPTVVLAPSASSADNIPAATPIPAAAAAPAPAPAKAAEKERPSKPAPRTNAKAAREAKQKKIEEVKGNITKMPIAPKSTPEFIGLARKLGDHLREFEGMGEYPYFVTALAKLICEQSSAEDIKSISQAMNEFLKEKQNEGKISTKLKKEGASAASTSAVPKGPIRDKSDEARALGIMEDPKATTFRDATPDDFDFM